MKQDEFQEFLNSIEWKSKLRPRTAPSGFLFAKKNNGAFLVRIEDTDKKREVAGAEEYIFKALDWCGIQIDEKTSDNSRRQSSRKELYQAKAKELIIKGLAYYAFDSEQELNSVSQSLQMLSTCIDMIYDNEESWDAADNSPEEINEFIEQLNTKQFKEVETFFETMPKLEHIVEVTNPKTGKASKVKLEGLASFFN